MTNCHNHDACPTEVQIRKFKDAAKAKAKSKQMTARQIFNEISREHREVAPLIGYKDVRNTLNNRRYANVPRRPNSIEEFVSLAPSTSNSTLINGNSEDWVCLTNEFLIDTARSISKISMDGTFYSLPKFVGFCLT